MNEVITPSIIDQALSYEEYVSFVKDRYAQGKCTDDHDTEDYLNYTKMSLSRMDRIDRKGILMHETIEKIKAIQQEQIWLALSEGWCADAAQSLPYFQKMSSLNTNIDFKVILREQHPKVMDEYLTNGTRSIPKVIVLDKNSLATIGSWGPRPMAAQKIVSQAKADKIDINDAAIKALIDYEKNKALQIWYKKDKGQSIQSEFLENF